jgi:formylglycine-generating enzyme required for sulfatase activity
MTEQCEFREHPRDSSLMVLIPAGAFQMGLPDDDLLAEEHEKPVRRVELPAFWIDVHPVTNARFGRFLEADGYDEARWWHPMGWAWRQREAVREPALWQQAEWAGPEQPVAGVSWYEADAYARWAGKRLPTDAEWEKAARGTDGRRYPWGDEWPGPERANFNNYVGHTTPVGLYPDGVSPYGCHDMAGNVNNWVADWYWDEFGQYCVRHGLLRSPVLDDALRARMAATALVEKVDRGGGFATPMLFHEVLSCTRKVHWSPHKREPWNGFRTVADGTDLGG